MRAAVLTQLYDSTTSERLQMRKTLVIGRHYRDLPIIVDKLPTGNDKIVARKFAVSYIGGNGVVAAFAKAKLGGQVELLSTVGQDEDGLTLVTKTEEYGIQLHHRAVRETSQSVIFLKDGARSIVRCRHDDTYLRDFPRELEEFFCLHLDGHQPDAAIHYARRFRERELLTSLDFGTQRENTWELLKSIDVVSISGDLCEDVGISPDDMIDRAREKECRICIVTLGKHGLRWCDESGVKRTMPAFTIPTSEIVDTCNAGDIHNGARLWSYAERPDAPWEEHLSFASAVAAQSLRHLGAMNKVENLPNVAAVRSMINHRPIAVGQ